MFPVMIILSFLTIPLNTFQPTEGSAEVSVFVKVVHILPPRPVFFSAIFPLIVMVMDSIMRGQNGQLN